MWKYGSEGNFAKGILVVRSHFFFVLQVPYIYFIFRIIFFVMLKILSGMWFWGRSMQNSLSYIFLTVEITDHITLL